MKQHELEQLTFEEQEELSYLYLLRARKEDVEKEIVHIKQLIKERLWKH